MSVERKGLQIELHVGQLFRQSLSELNISAKYSLFVGSQSHQLTTKCATAFVGTAYLLIL